MNSVINLPRLFATVICGVLLSFSTLVSAKAEIYTGFFSSVAVSGYDTVAYFTEGKPVKGNSKFKTKYKGADWHFSSAENLALFKEDPTKYAPQYGGYCAWAVGHNTTASGDPLQWDIENGKLYLNYDASIKASWVADKENQINLADKYWPGLID